MAQHEVRHVLRGRGAPREARAVEQLEGGQVRERGWVGAEGLGDGFVDAVVGRDAEGERAQAAAVGKDGVEPIDGVRED